MRDCSASLPFVCAAHAGQVLMAANAPTILTSLLTPLAFSHRGFANSPAVLDSYTRSQAGPKLQGALACVNGEMACDCAQICLSGAASGPRAPPPQPRRGGRPTRPALRGPRCTCAVAGSGAPAAGPAASSRPGRGGSPSRAGGTAGPRIAPPGPGCG